MKEVHIPPLTKQLATSLAIALFRATRALKRGLQTAFKALGRVLAPVGGVFLGWLVMPIYRAVVTLHLKFQRTVLPTRGLLLFFASNRYLFHAVLAIASIATIVMNLQARQALAQDVGQNSLLYALATDSDVEIVQEVARDGNIPHGSYFGNGAMMAIPHVDFDYNTTDDAVLADLSVPGAIGAPTITNTDDTGKPLAPRTKTETYIVKEGDTIGSIAKDFSVNVGTILWNNNLTERQYIRPGDSLKIPPVSGILATVKKGDTITKLASRYSANDEEIRAFNKIADESSLAIGTEIMIPGGTPQAVQQTVIAIAGRGKTDVGTSKSLNSFGKADGVSVNVNAQKPGDENTSNVPASKLAWPTNGHVITQYYGWNHTGVDIDGDFTSPLYASGDGVVTTAGWNTGGYGLQIVIKHPNGLMTRYAHSSKLFVKVGDEVKKGQVVAMMGSTGHSTGSHLHFEVYINGKRGNPLAYIK